MSKMHYFSNKFCLKCTILVTNFQNSPSAGDFPPPTLLTFNIGDLKFRDFAK